MATDDQDGIVFRRGAAFIGSLDKFLVAENINDSAAFFLPVPIGSKQFGLKIACARRADSLRTRRPLMGRRSAIGRYRNSETLVLPYPLLILRRAYGRQESFAFTRWSRLPKRLPSLARSRFTRSAVSRIA